MGFFLVEDTKIIKWKMETTKLPVTLGTQYHEWAVWCMAVEVIHSHMLFHEHKLGLQNALLKKKERKKKRLQNAQKVSISITLIPLTKIK